MHAHVAADDSCGIGELARDLPSPGTLTPPLEIPAKPAKLPPASLAVHAHAQLVIPATPGEVARGLRSPGALTCLSQVLIFG
ncbi:hypothetical protein [Nannocystis punicea]|uniref:Uncharacterized protein n=1 Tax=Nannocystis punicea TaxID=2995304 RepID=A0ABY7H902_9BACT|nr:hypothetical protein [Nannocystis poenicansa]WAS95737.1 hypothetical protein O0S08_06205 [Nannocystis poenicansa]